MDMNRSVRTMDEAYDDSAKSVAQRSKDSAARAALADLGQSVDRLDKHLTDLETKLDFASLRRSRPMLAQDSDDVPESSMLLANLRGFVGRIDRMDSTVIRVIDELEL